MQLLKKAFIFAVFCLPYYCDARKAFVSVPVADLVGEPIKSFGLASTNKESYQKIATSYVETRKNGIDSSYGAPRMHQLLFNEVVDIISEGKTNPGDEEEVCISIESAFFITKQTQKPQHVFYMQKKNLISFDTLKKRKLSLENIPFSPSYKHPDQKPDHQTIGLIKPFFDPVTKQTFSAGTLFVVDPAESSNEGYCIQIFDRNGTSYKQSCIPKSYAHEITHKSKHDTIACFVKLLKAWANCPDGVIFYVWGGYSYTERCPDLGFKEVTKYLINGNKIIIHERRNCTKKPLAGFDCVGLILRAAQLCGVPFFFKNTYTLAHYLKSLGIDDHLHEGDLIWIGGHVMIVSDLERNTLIEARGYDHDFGIVQEIALEKVFKDMKTYKDLIHAFYMHQPLTRLNKSGKTVETITHFKLLKLESAWHHHSFNHV